MSDYFTKQNTKEFGPGPDKEIEWLIIQDPKCWQGISQCAVVKAKHFHQAWEKAEKLIPNFRKQDCICFPNPHLHFEVNK